MAADVLDRVDDAANVLLLGPSVNEEVDAGCKRMLDDGRPMLVVSFSLSPAEWVRRWENRWTELPARTVLVTTSVPGADDVSIQVEYLSSPGDLTGLGMIISKHLERWHDEGIAPSVCFDSLTTLLQYDDIHNVYRFLHLITTRLSGAGARAHFHLDPATQDGQTVSTLTSTFSAVAEYDGETWNVRNR